MFFRSLDRVELSANIPHCILFPSLESERVSQLNANCSRDFSDEVLLVEP